jgi:hypothetical protein
MQNYPSIVEFTALRELDYVSNICYHTKFKSISSSHLENGIMGGMEFNSTLMWCIGYWWESQKEGDH